MLKEFKIHFQNRLIYVKAEKIKDQWWFQWQGRVFVVSEKKLKELEQTVCSQTQENNRLEKGSPALSKKTEVLSPVPAQVVKVLLSKGKKAAVGQPLLVLSSMKMEHTLYSPARGKIESVTVKKGDFVRQGQVLVVLCPDLKDLTKTRG